MLYFLFIYATIEKDLYMEVVAMRKVFQIIFCILSALSVLAAFFMGVFMGFLAALIGAAAALFFFVLTLFCKYGNPFSKRKEPKVDFMNSDEENEKIRNEQNL